MARDNYIADNINDIKKMLVDADVPQIDEFGATFVASQIAINKKMQDEFFNKLDLVLTDKFLENKKINEILNRPIVQNTYNGKSHFAQVFFGKYADFISILSIIAVFLMAGYSIEQSIRSRFFNSSDSTLKPSHPLDSVAKKLGDNTFFIDKNNYRIRPEKDGIVIEIK